MAWGLNTFGPLPRSDYKLDEDEDRWVVYNRKTGKIVGFKDYRGEA